MAAEQSHKKDFTKEPGVTVAMGMKPTRVSAFCWRDSCIKEDRIRRDWIATFRPQLLSEEEMIAERVKQREAEKKEMASTVPERALLYDGVSKDGKGRIAYLKARRQLPPQVRFGESVTTSHETGWRCLELPPPRPEGVPTFGRKPVIKNGFYRRTIGGSLAQGVY